MITCQMIANLSNFVQLIRDSRCLLQNFRMSEDVSTKNSHYWTKTVTGNSRYSNRTTSVRRPKESLFGRPAMKELGIGSILTLALFCTR